MRSAAKARAGNISGRNATLQKLQTQFLPESAAFLFMALMTAQVPELGPMLVLAQLGLFVALVAARPIDALRTFLRWWPLLLTPLLAFLSFIWSDMPAVSGRYGFQLLFTAFIGAYIANLISPARFTVMIFLSMLVFCVLSILSMRTGASAHGSVLVGYTGSKNQMALAGYMLLISGLAVALDRTQHALLRLATLPGMVIGLVIVAASNSATAVLIAAAAAPLMIAFHLSERLPPAGRVAVLLAIAVVLTPLFFIGPELVEALNRFMIDTLGKDPTLTGRTYLWARAAELIERRPVLGYGYQSIWMGDTADTIGLLRWAGMTDGRTFHFHNTFLQIGVDTGLIGMGSFVLAMLGIILLGARQFILAPSVATSFFFINFLIFAALAMTELILAPLLPRTMLLYACGVYAFRGNIMASQRKPAG